MREWVRGGPVMNNRLQDVRAKMHAQADDAQSPIL